MLREGGAEGVEGRTSSLKCYPTLLVTEGCKYVDTLNEGCSRSPWTLNEDLSSYTVSTIPQ